MVQLKELISHYGKTILISVLSLIFAVLISATAYKWGIKGMVIITLLSFVPVVVFLLLKYPKFGLIFYLIMAYWIMFLLNFSENFPLGTLMDVFLALLLIGFFIAQKRQPKWHIFKDQISVSVMIWLGYHLLQFFNPTAESRIAWVYTVRGIAGVMVSYFIFSYHVNSVKLVRQIIKIWILLSVIAALYALKQEYLGFFPFEQRALDSNPLLQSLLFVNGHWRKTSIFADPVSFSYTMVISSILCIALIFGPTSRRQKIFLGLAAALFLNVMLYSGTRAAYVLLPASMVLLVVLSFNRQIFIFSVIGGLFMAVLIFIPTSNPTLYRFQSAFKPSDDASFNVRKNNQKRIQPYIRSHPLGGGLGASGASGVRFAPYSFLAQFPPDSGYVRAAVELGWIGLMLLCGFMFIILRTGINNYFAIKDPELKTYCLAMVLIVFAITIGNFPQEAIIQFPLSIYFYLVIALINITLRLDRNKSEAFNNKLPDEVKK
jgi:putative inorganic carbon (HCO3(-)) transporter